MLLAGCGDETSRRGRAPTPPRAETALGEPFDVLEEAPGTYLIADRAANAVYRLRDGALETVAELEGPRDLEPAPDGRVLVASGRDVVALDPRTGATETVATARDDVLGIDAPAARSPMAAACVRGRARARPRPRRCPRPARHRRGPRGVRLRQRARAARRAQRRRRVLADGLDLPSFAAAAPGGALYVTEFGAGRLVRIERSGKVTPIADVPAPTALSVARDGSVLVTGLGGSVSRVDPETGEVETLA